MNRCWYVVADASRARLIEHTEGVDDWADVVDLVHAASRLPAAALASDTAGSAGHHRRLDPRRREHERFAREIVERLEAGLAQHRYERLVLIASNPFLGELRTQLPEAVDRRVVAVVAHDWTTLPDAALVAKLRTAGAPH
ncbi:MAG: hypothetical protein RJA99_119 [Pseudomonadota bacterium]|jgi:protein required for attachment to host cells